MFTVWVLAATALFMVDSSYGYLHRVGMSMPQQCFECPLKGPCDDFYIDKLSLPVRQCPMDHPYCGTFAEYPSFKSVIGCVPAMQNVCSLGYSGAQEFGITCYCKGAYCNAPFTYEFRKRLTNFALMHVPMNTSIDFAAAFWKTTRFQNVSHVNLYKMITILLMAQTSTTTLPTTLTPVVQALHVDTAVPTDDEEDGPEGSGADDDSRTLSSLAPSHTAAHPADNGAGARVLFFQVLSISMMGFFLI